MNPTPRGHGRATGEWPSDRKRRLYADAVRMGKEGIQVREIARRLDVPEATVRNWLKHSK